MSSSIRTYKSGMPEASINAMFPGAFTGGDSTTPSYITALVDDDLAVDIGAELAKAGWEDIGAGDLRPTEYSDTADPAVPTSAFTQAPILIGSAARLADLEDLRAATVRLEARQDAILALLASRGITNGSAP